MSQGIVNTGYPAKNVSTIPNSCDLELFDPASNDGALFRKKYDWLGDRPLVIYAGTLGQINGVSYLARLAEEIYELDPEIRFAVIGAGVDEKKVRDVAEELGVLNKNFFMLKNIAKKEMPSVFSAATVSTSLFIDLREMWANSANKFFDTLAAGKPVVINYGGWQAEIVERDRLGLVLDPKPDSEAARRLVDLIRSKSLQEEFSLNARAKAESSFSRDILARKLICTLEQVYEENL
jgi:glycosyltransferase involved in cell wall biosynthesis